MSGPLRYHHPPYPTHRPRIIKPKKRHNYRNLIPTYVLVPLSFETKKIAPFLTKLSPRKPKKWTKLPSETPSHLQGQEAANFPPLSKYPREEKVNAPKSHPDAADLKRKTTALTGVLETGTSSTRTHVLNPLSIHAEAFTPYSPLGYAKSTPSSLSSNAREFFPSLFVNTDPYSPESTISFNYDPWGNVKQCPSPEWITILC